MTLEVIKPGMLTTVQDAGRAGARHLGVSLCGALDDYAFRVANILVGNEPDAALLEVTLVGCRLRFLESVTVAVCGADLAPEIDGELIPLWRPITVKASASLRFANRLTGCRAYLALAGGLDLPPVLGSRSTDARAGFGGLDGRALRAGDVLRAGERIEESNVSLPDAFLNDHATRRFLPARWFVSYEARLAYNPHALIRVVRGKDFDLFDGASRDALFATEFELTPQSDRVGCRLRGAAINFENETERLSTAVAPGAIQVPPGGDPVVLLADCGTLGGYPVIAHVIQADLPLVAQLAPGDTLRFAEVSLDEAHRLAGERRRILERLSHAVRFKVVPTARRD